MYLFIVMNNISFQRIFLIFLTLKYIRKQELNS